MHHAPQNRNTRPSASLRWRRRSRQPTSSSRRRQPLRPHDCWLQYRQWRRSLLVALLGCASLLLAIDARGSEIQQPAAAAGVPPAGEDRLLRMGDAGTGSLLLRSGKGGLFRQAPRVNTDVSFQVTGLVAQVTVRQEFHNPGSDWVEGVYVFPLPERAAVNALRMQIGERIIVGEIQEKQQARKTYEAARKAGRRASLVSQERANLFTNSVANIGPGERVTVEIRYLETLRYEDGGFSLRFPMTLTPRFIPGDPLPEADRSGSVQVMGSGWAEPTDEVPDADRITPPQAYGLREDTQMATLRGTVAAGFPLDGLVSPYHALHTEQEGTSWRFELAAGQVPMHRDFVLRWQPRAGREPQAALFSEQRAESEYALLMLLPPRTNAIQKQPREIIFVIDTSGSMAGTSIRQAREALEMALARLRPEDRFNVIEFNTDFSRLFPQPVEGTARHVDAARRFVRGLQANGGTQMAMPLRAALQGEATAGELRQVVFITDGSIGNEEALFGIISRDLGNSRLFMVGIGSAPNTFFMEKAAEFGRGTATFVGDLDEVNERMASLFRRIETPAVTDLELDWGVADAETWPRTVRDLYAGETLLVTARMTRLPETVRVRGMLGGQPWERTVQVAPAPRRIGALKGKGGARPQHAPERGPQQNGIGTLWARSKIAALLDDERTTGKSETLRSQIIGIARDHALVTKYTSFVAVDRTPARPEGEKALKQAVPNRMPHGAQMTGFPRGATSAGLQILAGVLLVLLGLLLMRRTANPAAPASPV